MQELQKKGQLLGVGVGGGECGREEGLHAAHRLPRAPCGAGARASPCSGPRPACADTGAAWRPHREDACLYTALGRSTERANACGCSVPVGVPPCLCVWLTCGTQQLPAHPTPSRGTQLEQTQVSATLGRKQGARLPGELIKGDLASEGETGGRRAWREGTLQGLGPLTRWSLGSSGAFYTLIVVLRA